MDTVDTVRAFFASYHHQDRAAAERLAAAGFVFTSPQDEHIDRDAFFERCFPTADRMSSVEFLHTVAVDAERVFVQYEYVLTGGDRHRNVEVITVRDGQVVEAEVYFGGKF